MTFDDVMKKYAGKWEDGKAVIQAEGGYFWVIARGNPETYTLTNDGLRYVKSAVERAATEPKRRGRKAVSDVVSVDE